MVSSPPRGDGADEVDGSLLPISRRRSCLCAAGTGPRRCGLRVLFPSNEIRGFSRCALFERRCQHVCGTAISRDAANCMFKDIFRSTTWEEARNHDKFSKRKYRFAGRILKHGKL